MILGTIGTYTAGSGVTLTIDGEETPTTKDYKFLSSYSPVAGDRVLIEEIGNSYVVLGKLTESAGGDSYELSRSATDYATVQLVDSGGNVISTVTVDRPTEALGVKNWYTTGVTGSAYSIEFRTNAASYSAATQIQWRARSGANRGAWKTLANG